MFINTIKKLNKPAIIFVDMDGVVAEFDIGNKKDFHLKRPLFHNINLLKNINKMNDFEIHILSVAPYLESMEQKEIWLDKYMSFVFKENRHILLKNNLTSKELKSGFLNKYDTNKQKILIDDDNNLLLYIMKNNKDVILFQDSSLIE